ncbi:MAG: tetratricopeptide repeat protein [Gemmatimonadota bacterium]
MSDYSTRDIADLLGVEPEAVRRYASTAELDPDRDKGDRYSLSFQDMVLIRTAIELASAGVPHQRVHQSLRRLREQLPTGRPLAAVRISTDGAELIVQDGNTVWSPESGQVILGLATPSQQTRVTSLDRRRAKAVERQSSEMSAEEWYELGCVLIERLPEQALQAFRSAVGLNPNHAEAHVNAGFVLQSRHENEQAEAAYRLALEADSSCAIAAYNLGVVLEDQRRPEEALSAYALALEADPDMPDAHFNLSRLSEEMGDRATALQHLRAYSRLLRAPRAT